MSGSPAKQGVFLDILGWVLGPWCLEIPSPAALAFLNCGSVDAAFILPCYTPLNEHGTRKGRLSRGL